MKNKNVSYMRGALPAIILIVAVALVAAVFAAVGPLGKGKPNKIVRIPGVAAEKSPAIVPLGVAIDPGTGKLVEGYAFIDYKKDFAKPPWAGGGKEKTTKCYSFLGKGAKWKEVEPWMINPSNAAGLTSDFLLSNLTADIEEWEDAADGVIDLVQGANILGDGSTTSATLVADTSAPDNQNEIYFADIESEGAIAVTIVWGIFRGPPSQRELVEWDQVYDDTDFDWSSTGETGKMDFENIAQHELGHSLGLGHPEDSCTEETMYRFAETGETKKQTLEAGDIAGVNDLYLD